MLNKRVALYVLVQVALVVMLVGFRGVDMANAATPIPSTAASLALRGAPAQQAGKTILLPGNHVVAEEKPSDDGNVTRSNSRNLSLSAALTEDTTGSGVEEWSGQWQITAGTYQPLNFANAFDFAFGPKDEVFATALTQGPAYGYTTNGQRFASWVGGEAGGEGFVTACQLDDDPRLEAVVTFLHQGKPGLIRAYDGDSWTMLWERTFTAGTWVPASCTDLDSDGRDEPLQGTYDGSLHALDEGSGVDIWSVQDLVLEDVHTPVISGGNIVFGVADDYPAQYEGRLYALDFSGNLLWYRNEDGLWLQVYMASGPITRPDAHEVVVPEKSGLHILDAATGMEVAHSPALDVSGLYPILFRANPEDSFLTVSVLKYNKLYMYQPKHDPAQGLVLQESASMPSIQLAESAAFANSFAIAGGKAFVETAHQVRFGTLRVIDLATGVEEFAIPMEIGYGGIPFVTREGKVIPFADNWDGTPTTRTSIWQLNFGLTGTVEWPGFLGNAKHTGEYEPLTIMSLPAETDPVIQPWPTPTPIVTETPTPVTETPTPVTETPTATETPVVTVTPTPVVTVEPGDNTVKLYLPAVMLGKIH